jgi:hypothetical protein
MSHAIQFQIPFLGGHNESEMGSIAGGGHAGFRRYG